MNTPTTKHFLGFQSDLEERALIEWVAVDDNKMKTHRLVKQEKHCFESSKQLTRYFQKKTKDVQLESYISISLIYYNIFSNIGYT